MLNGLTAAPIQGFDYERNAAMLQIGPKDLQLAHPAKDGHVVTLVSDRQDVPGSSVDPRGRRHRSTKPSIGREDWKSYDYRIFRGGEFDVSLEELTETVDRYFATKTKRELFLPGLDLGLTIAPVMTLDDMLTFEQLEDRAYFHEVELPGGGTRSRPRALRPLEPPALRDPSAARRSWASTRTRSCASSTTSPRERIPLESTSEPEPASPSKASRSPTSPGSGSVRSPASTSRITART